MSDEQAQGAQAGPEAGRRDGPFVNVKVKCSRQQDRGGHRHLATGLALILLGALFLLDNLRIVDLRLAWDAWPLFIVLFGVVRSIDSQDRSSGLWLVAIGLWLFVNEYELWGLSYGDSWPLLVVVVGISMVFKAMRGSQTPPANG